MLSQYSSLQNRGQRFSPRALVERGQNSLVSFGDSALRKPGQACISANGLARRTSWVHQSSSVKTQAIDTGVASPPLAMLSIYQAERPGEVNMSDDLAQLMKAREALIRERRSRTATIVKTSGSISDDAMNAFIKVQEAIEVIDAAIDGLRYEQEDEEMDDE